MATVKARAATGASTRAVRLVRAARAPPLRTRAHTSTAGTKSRKMKVYCDSWAHAQRGPLKVGQIVMPKKAS